MRHVMSAAVVVMVVASSVLAASLAGVTVPDTVQVGDDQLVLNGMGLRSKLWVKVYVGALYLERKSNAPEFIVDSKQNKRVVMHFLTDRATKAKMDDAWREGFAANSPGSSAELGDSIEKFIGFFGDMKTGDRVEIDIISGKGTTVTLNGEEKGVIEGDAFARALLLVWLGDEPPTEDLKEGMLGK